MSHVRRQRTSYRCSSDNSDKLSPHYRLQPIELASRLCKKPFGMHCRHPATILKSTHYLVKKYYTCSTFGVHDRSSYFGSKFQGNAFFIKRTRNSLTSSFAYVKHTSRTGRAITCWPSYSLAVTMGDARKIYQFVNQLVMSDEARIPDSIGKGVGTFSNTHMMAPPSPPIQSKSKEAIRVSYPASRIKYYVITTRAAVRLILWKSAG